MCRDISCPFHLDKTGQGQKVETSMIRALLSVVPWIEAGFDPDDWAGFMVEGPCLPAATGYKTKDTPIIWGLLNLTREESKKAFAEICRECGFESLLDDPRMAIFGAQTVGLGKDAEEMKPLWEAAFTNKNSAELVALINGLGGLVAPFQGYETVFGDQRLASIQVWQEIEHPVAGKTKTLGPLWHFSNLQVKIQSPPPNLGQHTAEILGELGYSLHDIMELQRLGIVLIG